MADVPNADADCFWQSRQWQQYTSMGLGREAVICTAPHWHSILGFIVAC
jgi:hypothetical protein